LGIADAGDTELLHALSLSCLLGLRLSSRSGLSWLIEPDRPDKPE